MKTGRGDKVGGAAALMVFCIFAMLAFSVLVLGASAYKNIAGASRDDSDERICLSYIWTTVKTNDKADSICVGEHNGVSALLINETIGDTVYSTIIYYHDGWVYELFADSGYEFSLGEGAHIIQTDSLRFEEDNEGGVLATSGNISVYITPRGKTELTAKGGW